MPDLFDSIDPAPTLAEVQAGATPHFDGATFDPDLDAERLGTQLVRVRAVMADGNWHTLAELAALR